MSCDSNSVILLHQSGIASIELTNVFWLDDRSCKLQHDDRKPYSAWGQMMIICLLSSMFIIIARPKLDPGSLGMLFFDSLTPRPNDSECAPSCDATMKKDIISLVNQMWSWLCCSKSGAIQKQKPSRIRANPCKTSGPSVKSACFMGHSSHHLIIWFWRSKMVSNEGDKWCTRPCTTFRGCEVVVVAGPVPYYAMLCWEDPTTEGCVGPCLTKSNQRILENKPTHTSSDKKCLRVSLFHRYRMCDGVTSPSLRFIVSVPQTKIILGIWQ